MFERYTHEEILEYVKYRTKSLKDSEKILDEVRDWSCIKRRK